MQFFLQDILRSRKQVYDCRAIDIYDRSTSSGDDAKVYQNKSEESGFIEIR